ncbi:MAG: hypothetical protein Q9196_000399 [Gyalolechia fulgens]
MNGKILLMQRPIFRLVGQGAAWVALFIILSGFVNSLKPIKLARGGATEPALSTLAVSSFRRSFRLVLPATAATIISWIITQFGAYETAKNSNAYWLYITSPGPSSSWGTALEDLLHAIRTTWTYNPDNPYDQPQWALLYLLQGSMFVFTALLVTINLTPRWRVLTMIFVYFWSWNWSIQIGDPWLLFSRQQITEIEEEGTKHMRYPLPGTTTFLVVMPIFFVVLFAASHFWATKVEPRFGIMTKTAEDIMFGKRDKVAALPVRRD